MAGGVDIQGGNLTVKNDANIIVGNKQVIGAQQAAVDDVSAANDPGDGTLAAASSDVATLAAQSEKLRDLVDEIRTQMNDLLGKLHGWCIAAKLNEKIYNCGLIPKAQ